MNGQRQSVTHPRFAMRGEMVKEGPKGEGGAFCDDSRPILALAISHDVS